MTQQPIRTVKIGKKEYVDVAERVRLAHADAGFSMIDQQCYQIAEHWFVSVTIEVKGCRFIGDAQMKFESAKPGSADETNPLECAQTSALGRALGFAGYGALESIASVDEVVTARKQSEPSLDEQIKRAKKRAMALSVARNAEEWAGVLSLVGLEQITGLADLAKVNGYLTQVERRGKTAHQSS